MRSAPRKQSQFSQLEFCFQPARITPAPSADELRERAVSLLRNAAAPRLATRLRVQWNARMRTAVGRAEPRRALITLNPLLQQFGAGEIERTLRHELAHLLAQDRAGRRRILPHGTEWRRACAELGIAGERACHKLPIASRPLPQRFLYHCGNCGGHFPRARRIRRAIACLRCCRAFACGQYDERFRLRLTKI